MWQCVADAVWSLVAALMVLPPMAGMTYPTPIESPGCVPLGFLSDVSQVRGMAHSLTGRSADQK